MTTQSPFGISVFDVLLVSEAGVSFRFNWPAIEEVAAMPTDGMGSKAIGIYHARALLAARDEGAKR